MPLKHSNPVSVERKPSMDTLLIRLKLEGLQRALNFIKGMEAVRRIGREIQGCGLQARLLHVMYVNPSAVVWQPTITISHCLEEIRIGKPQESQPLLTYRSLGPPSQVSEAL
jgi:hypothetical protein